MRLPRLSHPRLVAALAILGAGAVAAGVTFVLVSPFTHSPGPPGVSALVPAGTAMSQAASSTPCPTSTACPLVTATRVPSPTATVTLAPSPTATAEQQSGALRVPVLMYHHVGDPPPGADEMRLRLTVDNSSFAAQLQLLADRGYETITLGDVAAALAGGSLPPKPVLLTFDDGYADSFDIALPLLQRYGMTGVFFIVSGLVGTDGYMTWERVQTLAGAGMEVEAHSRWHTDLTKASAGGLDEEVAGSKRDLEERLGVGVRFFCYPSGTYNDAVIAALAAAGYTGAVTTTPGFAGRTTTLFEIPRQRVSGGLSLGEFARLLGETLD